MTMEWVVDNGSSHAGRTSIKRVEGAYANRRLIHLPIYASGANPIEIYAPCTCSTRSATCWR